jgi:hypothetical protein
MKITREQLKGIVREVMTEELTLNNSINETIDLKKFEKAVLDSDKLHSNIYLRTDEIFHSVLAGLILKMGLAASKKYVKELTDMYKSMYY